MKTFIWIFLRKLLYIYRIFPIKNERILFFSFSGKKYTCNPKYISEYIVSNYPGQFEIIWAFTNPIENQHLEKSGVKVIRFNSLAFFKYFFSSRIIITNDSFYSYLEKRDGQKVIQTWHGGGAYKKVGKSNKLYSASALKQSNFIMKNVDLYLSSCHTATEELIRGAFDFDGEVLEKGMPRNDFLINKTGVLNKVRDYYEISKSTILVLYAPTYRQNLETDIYNINFEGLKLEIEKKYNKECIIMYRTHHKFSNENTLGLEGDYLIDVSGYSDMQELLYDSDILITDYSSSMWDFSLMYKPCFLYTVDAEKYIKDRDFYVPMKDWPFPIAQNNEELLKNIIDFNKKEYIRKIKEHHYALGSFETGKATVSIGKYIYQTCYNK